MKTAWEELVAALQDGETIETIVFGESRGTVSFVPVEFQRRLLSAEDARPLMQTWRFTNEYADGYPHRTVIWTNLRVLRTFVGGEECSWLVGAPRHPTVDAFVPWDPWQ